MEKTPIIKQENDTPQPLKVEAHSEAFDFVARHRDFFEHYARGKVNIEPAPAGLNTFAFNLENNTIYVNDRFYKDRGFSEEKTSFATLHEIEHFQEKLAILAEDGGERAFDRYLRRIGESEAYSLMDNCVADIRENRAVVEKSWSEKAFRDIEIDLYKNDLFKEIDFTEEPKHIQFAQALLREARVSDEVCVVAPEVRERLDALRMKSYDGESFFDIMTSPDVPMSARLALQNEHIWPLVKELLDQDIEEEKKKDKKEEGQDGGEGDGNPNEGEQKKREDKDAKEKIEGKSGAPSPKESSLEGGVAEGGETDPNEMFKEAYVRAKEKMPEAVPIEEIKKAFKEWQEIKKENPQDAADKEYAEKIGVKKEDLKKYRDIVKKLEAIKNPETDMSVVEELYSLFARIVAERRKLTPAPRYPIEEGENLVDPAELVAQAMAGNFEPKVWETHEIKEKKGKKFGEIEITLVCDRSDSMDGAKCVEQQKASVLMMEALKEFSKVCDEERVNMEQPLEVRSEIYSFQSTSADKTPLKKMSKELGEKERIECSAVLSTAPGDSTTDFVPLETIANNISEDLARQIEEGNVKKIVIVFTDGDSDDSERVKNVLKKLRDKKIIVIGVGITKDGKSALTTYSPDARLAETAGDLPVILAELLKKELMV